MSDADVTRDPEATGAAAQTATEEVATVEAEVEAAIEAAAAEPITANTVAAAAPPPPSPEELAAIAATAPVPTTEELAAMAAAVEVAAPLPGVGDTDTSYDDAMAAPAEPAKPVHARRRRIRGWMFRLVTSLFALALFIGGVAIGVNTYQRIQPPPPVVGDPSTGGIPTPPVVKELADALASNDADSLRSAVSGDPYRLLTGELQSWQIQGVTSVETLATMQDGPRSATEIIITGRSMSGDPRVFNLVVHVNDNQIVDFR
jgi:hypothetical protein